MATEPNTACGPYRSLMMPAAGGPTVDLANVTVQLFTSVFRPFTVDARCVYVADENAIFKVRR